VQGVTTGKILEAVHCCRWVYSGTDRSKINGQDKVRSTHISNDLDDIVADGRRPLNQGRVKGHLQLATQRELAHALLQLAGTHVHRPKATNVINASIKQGSFPVGTPGNGVPKVFLTVETRFRWTVDKKLPICNKIRLFESQNPGAPTVRFPSFFFGKRSLRDDYCIIQHQVYGRVAVLEAMALAVTMASRT